MEGFEGSNRQRFESKSGRPSARPQDPRRLDQPIKVHFGRIFGGIDFPIRAGFGDLCLRTPSSSSKALSLQLFGGPSTSLGRMQ